MRIFALTRSYHRFSIMDIRTFIFLDCETTGLPSFECGKTRITELCMIAVESNHLKLGVFPRVQNKISFCFNPKRLINPEVSNMTGLYNDLLEHQPCFDNNLGSFIKNFLKLFKPPLCFVAHNGKRFDFPLLKKHLEEIEVQLPQDLLYIDSLEAFRCLHKSNVELKLRTVPQEIPFEFSDDLDDVLNNATKEAEEEFFKKKNFDPQKINETTPKRPLQLSKCVTFNSPRKRLNFGVSFKLKDVYLRLINKEPKNAHKAECDVDMLIECAATLGEQFTEWGNNNARNFTEIMPILFKK